MQPGKLRRVLQTAQTSLHHTLYSSRCGKGAKEAFCKKGSSTFHEDAWGKANDLGQDGEEGPDTGALRLPVLKNLEDAPAHESTLSFSVSLQSRTGS